MQLHELKPVNKNKKPKRIGRGGKRGTYSGRGIKGQKARAGRKFQPVIRELIKKYHKLRGYRFKSIKRSDNKVTINLNILDKKFNESEIVTPKTLFERKIIKMFHKDLPKVKILAKGEITKKIIVKDCEVSKKAKEKIEKAGGFIQLDSLVKIIKNENKIKNMKDK
jgi:large subunit ribosomal protein L15